MKYILIIMAFILSSELNGQIYTEYEKTPTYKWLPSTGTATIYLDSRPVCSKLDTTVLFSGIDTASHSHVYVSETHPDYQSYSTGTAMTLVYRPCLDSHIGCPESWLNQNQICELCLKHINIRETRWYEDKYQKALDRLNKLKK